MSYNGIGLPTPRGTGTSGYVQRNASALTPAAQARRGAYGRRQEDSTRAREREARFHRTNYVERKVDAGVLEHERRRAIEVECMALRDELEDQPDISEAEIERRVDELRSLLKARAEDEKERGGAASSRNVGNGVGSRPTQYKAHQVHEIVHAKEIENDRFRTEVLHRQRDYHRNRDHRERDHDRSRRRRRHSVSSHDRDRSLSPPREDVEADRRTRRERSPSHDLRHRRRSSVESYHTPRRSRRASLASRSRSPQIREEDEEPNGRINRRSSVVSVDREHRRRGSVVSRDHGSVSPENPRRGEFQRRGSRYGGIELDYN